MASMVCVCSNDREAPNLLLRKLTTKSVDDSLGLTCCAELHVEAQYTLGNCGLALVSGGADPRDGCFQLHCSENELVVFKGRIENSKELHMYTLNCAPEGQADDQLLGDAELVARLYTQRKFHFMASLKGRFSFVHYSLKARQLLAARDASGSYKLYQVRMQA